MSNTDNQAGDDGQEAPAYFKSFVTEFHTEVAEIKRVAEETRDECRNEVQQTKAQAQKNACHRWLTRTCEAQRQM